jgi:F-type H+-transporting ATPase subunit b
MLSLVFAAAASAAGAQAAAPSDGPAGLLQKFGVEWQYVIWQFISFAILASVLYQFAIKPILAAVDERNARIAEGLKNAAATVAKLAQAQQDAAAVAKQAQNEAAKFVEEARKAAKEFLDAQQKEAIARANDLIVKTRQGLELDRKQMLEEARTEVARLVVATTERVLARELSDADRSRYNEAAAREVAGIKD